MIFPKVIVRVRVLVIAMDRVRFVLRIMVRVMVGGWVIVRVMVKVIVRGYGLGYS